MTKEVYIVSAVRTPIGSFMGSLSSLSATELGAIAIKNAVEKSGIAPEMVEEVIMGNVMSANVGQSPAKQAAIFAGLPNSVSTTTVNKVCASGLKAIVFGAQAILAGDRDIVVAGGMESMSNVPFYLDKARSGYGLGDGKLIDGLVKDGLWDVYNNQHMGSCAEKCANDYSITREQQDDFAIESYSRAAKAFQSGAFNNEIIPVEVKIKKDTITVTEDEDYKKVIFEKIPSLRPVFDSTGTVTAANASNLNDGAAAVVLVSGEKLKELGIKPLAKIIGYADHEQEPENFTTAPAGAIRKALDKAGKNIEDVDYFEINEAFSVVSLANNKLLNIDSSKVNINGGAVAIGHPLGASGCRIMVTLLHILENNNAKIGATGICNGGGGSTSVVVERV
jgi:acetyl-CoA C-acetyltransferase